MTVLVIDATTTWVAPPGTTSIEVEMWGGGGGGSGYSPSGGGAGGGGGAYSKAIYSVTPGSSYTVTVGAAGTGGAGVNQNGGAGGDSWFDSSAAVMAKGGSGGTSATGVGGAGGASASGVGTTKTSGGTGGNRSGTSGGGGGGSGGDTTGGGNGGTPTTAGAAGTTNGAAGGAGGLLNNNGSAGGSRGGGGGGAGTNNNGGAGSGGRVRITFTSTAPAVEAVATTDGGTATTTPAVNLPAGIQAGETLLVVFRSAVAGAIGFPAGWTELFDASPDASDDQFTAAWKKATGTEGATISLTAASGKFGALAWRISNAADPTVSPPEISTVAIGTSTSNPEATAVTPSGGSKDYLFGTFCGMEGEANSPPTYPTGFYMGQIAADSGTAGAVGTNVRLAGAWVPETGTTKDPGAFAYTGTRDDWSAYAIAVYPAVVAPVFVPRQPAMFILDPGLV